MKRPTIWTDGKAQPGRSSAMENLRLRANALRERLKDGSWIIRHLPGVKLVADFLTKVTAVKPSWERFWKFVNHQGSGSTRERLSPVDRWTNGHLMFRWIRDKNNTNRQELQASRSHALKTIILKKVNTVEVKISDLKTETSPAGAFPLWDASPG